MDALDVTQDVLTEIGDYSLRTMLGASINGDKTVPWMEPDDPSRVSFVVRNPAGTAGERFQLIRQHARGGIGQVWLARDGELQRDVAVKEIQPRYAESESQRARFVLGRRSRVISSTRASFRFIAWAAMPTGDRSMRCVSSRVKAFPRRSAVFTRLAPTTTARQAAKTPRGASSFGSYSGDSSTFATRSISPTAGTCCIGT